jgi:hypothetical protein
VFIFKLQIFLPDHDNVGFLGSGRFGRWPGGGRRCSRGGGGGCRRSVRNKRLLLVVAADPLDVDARLAAVAVIQVGVFAVDVVRPVADEVVGVENGAGAARHLEQPAVGALDELGALVRMRPNARGLWTPDGRPLHVHLLKGRRWQRVRRRQLRAAIVILLQATLLQLFFVSLDGY